MAEENETIVVTGRRLPSDGATTGGWQFTAVIQNQTTGTTTALTSTANFNSELNSLSKQDKVVVEIEIDGKKLKIQFDGMNGRDIQDAFANVLTTITGALDGTLLASISQITNSSVRTQLTTYVTELAGDLISSAERGIYIRFEGTASLSNEFAAQYNYFKAGDLNGDGIQEAYHSILVNTNTIGSGENVRFDVSVIHELFHLREGETTDVDYARFGVTDGNHSPIFDRVAAKFLGLTKDREFNIGSSTDGLGIQGIGGTQGSDALGLGSGYRGAFIESYEGNDLITTPFSNSVLDGGSGDDIYAISGGSGRVVVFDDGGYDLIDFGSGYSRSQLLVRLDQGWIELGINVSGVLNATTSDLSTVVIIPGSDYGSNSIETVRIGGQTILMSELIAEANSAPFLTVDPQLYAGSTFQGGSLGQLGGKDLDGDALTYSLISVSGYAADLYWSVADGDLWVGASAPPYRAKSYLIVRIGDGQKYTDTPITVVWDRASDVRTDAPLPVEDPLTPTATYAFENAAGVDFTPGSYPGAVEQSAGWDLTSYTFI